MLDAYKMDVPTISNYVIEITVTKLCSYNLGCLFLNLMLEFIDLGGRCHNLQIVEEAQGFYKAVDAKLIF